eukprot:9466061-Pyramimonas_sp.AAC.1
MWLRTPDFLERIQCNHMPWKNEGTKENWLDGINQSELDLQTPKEYTQMIAETEKQGKSAIRCAPHNVHTLNSLLLCLPYGNKMTLKPYETQGVIDASRVICSISYTRSSQHQKVSAMGHKEEALRPTSKLCPNVCSPHNKSDDVDIFVFESSASPVNRAKCSTEPTHVGSPSAFRPSTFTMCAVTAPFTCDDNVSQECRSYCSGEHSKQTRASSYLPLGL